MKIRIRRVEKKRLFACLRVKVISAKKILILILWLTGIATASVKVGANPIKNAGTEDKVPNYCEIDNFGNLSGWTPGMFWKETDKYSSLKLNSQAREGKNCLEIAYEFPNVEKISLGWSKRPPLEDWTAYKKFSFWLKGDGSPNRFCIRMFDDKNSSWLGTEEISLGFNEWRHFTFFLSEFKDYWNGAKFQWDNVSSMVLIIQKGKDWSWNGSIYVDEISLVGPPPKTDVKLAAIFGDNMVLQGDKPIKIWGTGDPNKKITVTLGDQKAVASTDADGKWLVKLNPMKAGGPYTMTVKGKNTITLNNILIGEVWLASGQSNMQLCVKETINAAQEISDADYAKIRLFTVKEKFSLEPQSDVEGCWVECSPLTVGIFSAAAYYFGRNLYGKLNVPIGLIHSSWVGTPSEAWTSLPTLQQEPEFKPVLNRLDQFIDQCNSGAMQKKKEEYQKKLEVWEKLVKEKKGSGEKLPQKPYNPYMPQVKSATLYNAMISPITSLAIRGVIWYQGESNSERAYQYRKLFPALIDDWRKAWGDNFPFLFVQIANLLPKKAEPGDSRFAELREAQLMTLSVPNTAMAVTIDIGEVGIHPRNKQDVGLRLSLAALAKVYGKEIVYSGPVYKSMKIEGDKIRLYFDHPGSGLMIDRGNEPTGFSIAGEDKKFYWAKAVIDGNTIIVSNKNVVPPVAVRYAWAENPDCNLYNKEGLPASPFRTDDWEGITHNNK